MPGILHVKLVGRITGNKPELEKNFPFTFLNSIKYENPPIIKKLPWSSCYYMPLFIMIYPNIQLNVCVLLRPWPCCSLYMFFSLLSCIPLTLLHLSICHNATLQHSSFYSLAPCVLLLPSFPLFCLIAHHMLMFFFLPLYFPGYKWFMESFTGERHIHGCSVRVTLTHRNNSDVIVIMGIVCLGVYETWLWSFPLMTYEVSH